MNVFTRACIWKLWSDINNANQRQQLLIISQDSDDMCIVLILKHTFYLNSKCYWY